MDAISSWVTRRSSRIVATRSRAGGSTRAAPRAVSSAVCASTATHAARSLTWHVGMRFAPEPNTGAGFPSHASRKTRRNPSGNSPPPYNTPWRATRVSSAPGVDARRTKRSARAYANERDVSSASERDVSSAIVPVPIPAATRLAVPTLVLPTVPPPRHRRRSSRGASGRNVANAGSSPAGGAEAQTFGLESAMTARGFPSLAQAASRASSVARAMGSSPGSVRTTTSASSMHRRFARSCASLYSSGSARNDSVTYSSSSPANRRPRTAHPAARSASARWRPRRVSARGSHADFPARSAEGGREAEAPRRAPTTATPARAHRRSSRARSTTETTARDARVMRRRRTRAGTDARARPDQNGRNLSTTAI